MVIEWLTVAGGHGLAGADNEQFSFPSSSSFLFFSFLLGVMGLLLLYLKMASLAPPSMAAYL